jgi:hypothetical protein
MKHYNINYRKCCNYRCATDSSTRIVSQGLHEAKLSFNSFEFHNSKDNVYVDQVPLHFFFSHPKLNYLFLPTSFCLLCLIIFKIIISNLYGIRNKITCFSLLHYEYWIYYNDPYWIYNLTLCYDRFSYMTYSL